MQIQPLHQPHCPPPSTIRRGTVLKVELHAHTAQDPCDYIPHTTRELIDRASALGYAALAITLHDRHYDPAPDQAYAQARGLLLIQGIERTIEGRHILLINFSKESEAVASFDDLRALKRQHPSGLVIAPHAFYPIGTAVRADADRHPDVIDAVEVNSVFTSWLDFNPRAVRWARAHGKPVVGNTDLHRLDQLGTTFTLVDAPADADAICDAIRAGRVELRSNPLSTRRLASIVTRMLVGDAIMLVRRVLRPARGRGLSAPQQ
jgi:predicted metal-dependent phosphoesterase TrpH